MSKPFQCLDCKKWFRTEQGKDDHVLAKHLLTKEFGDPETKDWKSECCVCGESPCVAGTDLCGPCCFGEAETIGGNW